MIIGIHHFGFAVEDLDNAVRLYEKMGFEVFMRFEKVTIGAKSVMVKKGKSHIELWEFSDPKSELSQKIARHFAFESDDIEGDVQAYLEAGYKISIPISEGTVVKLFAYVQDALGNQIELLEPLDG